MTTIDPTTGRPLPADAIQRVLFICPQVELYRPPPLTSTKGFKAGGWEGDKNCRFPDVPVVRIRIIETAIPNSKFPSGESLSAALLLELPSTGELFVAAPYNHAGIVEQALDSSRYFSIRLQGEGGQKATIGIGFRERSDAFDFSVSLQELRRTLGLEPGHGGPQGQKVPAKEKEVPKKDFSLKEGEMITVNIGGMKAKSRRNAGSSTGRVEESGSNGTFSLPPPPGGGLLPPPPSAQEVRSQKRLSRTVQAPQEDSGFDDGEFGEFQ